MDDRILRFRVGVVVVAAAVITVILIMLLGAWPNPFRSTYRVNIEFPEAPGVAEDTPVLKSGIHVGRVSRVELQEDGDVMLRLDLDSQYRIRANEICRIGTGSLITGDAVLEFVTDPDAPDTDQFLANDDVLTNGVVASDPFQIFANMEGQIGSAIGSIERAGNQVSQLAGNLNETLGENDQQISRILQNTEKAMDEMGKAMATINELVGDPELKERLKKTMQDLPDLFQDARTTLAETRKTLAGFDRVSVRAERNLANLENFTGPLAERGEELAEDLAGSVSNINELLDQLVQFSEALNSGEGTLGQLVNDRELYDQLLNVMANIEDATRRIRPIIQDIRIFSDKIARDPRILGAKGALDRRPSGAGTKWPILEDGTEIRRH